MPAIDELVGVDAVDPIQAFGEHYVFIYKNPSIFLQHLQHCDFLNHLLYLLGIQLLVGLNECPCKGLNLALPSFGEERLPSGFVDQE